MWNIKKIKWANLQCYTKTLIFSLFALFGGKYAFFHKSDKSSKNVLWYSIFMQKIIKNACTVQKIIIKKIISFEKSSDLIGRELSLINLQN